MAVHYGTRTIRNAYLGGVAQERIRLGRQVLFQRAHPAQLPRITAFQVSPNTIDLDTRSTGNVTFGFNVSGATAYKIINARTGAVVPLSAAAGFQHGGTVAQPRETTQYNLTATNSAGAVSQSVTVTVTQNPVISSFRVVGYRTNPLSPHGSTVQFEAHLVGQPVPRFTADQGIGEIAPRHYSSGVLSFSHYFGVSGNRTVTLTATNSSGTATARVTVTVP